MSPKLSVLTLCRGRERHLHHLLETLAQSELLPDEVVIAVMDERTFVNLPPVPFPVRQFLIGGNLLPLAAARNLAAKKAQNDLLIFLDVDCLPSRKLLGSYADALAQEPSGIFQGEVFYLPACDLDQWPHHIREEQLTKLGIRHPSKQPFPSQGYQIEPNFGELWGLSFALHRHSFDAAGGFDESFIGYAGEETDFAQSLRVAGLKLYRVAQALAFHQHHQVAIPPLHHFQTIITNSLTFYQKWNRWCMEYWLQQFHHSGLIDWKVDAGEIEILRQPTTTEVEDSKQPGSVRFS